MSDKLIKSIVSSPVYDVAKVTPLNYLSRISELTSNDIYLKREDLQPVHSFKLRGAYHKIYHLSEKERQKGVVCASAGNHAQGVAFAAQKLNIKASIFMPATTPEIKVNAVKSFGANVFLSGDSYDDAYEKSCDYISKKGGVYIHPFDDEEVIAGQGTIAKEILDTLHEGIDYVFIPVGGGGLLAGISAYVKHHFPGIKIIAVEPENSACFHVALKAKKPVMLDHVGIFADGVAVRQIGKTSFKIAAPLVDGTIQVSTDEICSAVKDIYDDIRAISEPSGALSLAGMRKYIRKHQLNNKTMVGILCGANINFHRLRHISERAEIGEKKEALLAVTIPEKKGSFLSFCNVLKNHVITEFNYRYSDNANASIFVGVQLNNSKDDKRDLISSLKEQGYKTYDLTDNEMAKLHIRYMVGGKSEHVKNENVYRFQFPERPGALLTFLKKLGKRYNISLFHYRNHGAAFGRVLAGIQVQKDDQDEFELLLNSIGYTYFSESKNIAYSLFC